MYLSQVNAAALYFIVGGILMFILLMCVLFMVKSYRAGVAMGMDKKVLKRAVTSSITFTIVPSISILLGVIALSGSLGVPLSWLRLSVIGSLQYELNVAEISATAVGLTGLKVSEMTIQSFTTISLVMTACIFGGILCSLFFLKRYLKKVQIKPESAASGKPSFSAIAVPAMFIGLCSAYIGSYVGEFTFSGDYIPLMTAAVAGVVMFVFEYFTVKKNMGWLDNFSVAASMMIAMVAAVFANLL